MDEGAPQQPPRRNVHDDPAVLGVSVAILLLNTRCG